MLFFFNYIFGGILFLIPHIYFEIIVNFAYLLLKKVDLCGQFLWLLCPSIHLMHIFFVIYWFHNDLLVIFSAFTRFPLCSCFSSQIKDKCGPTRNIFNRCQVLLFRFVYWAEPRLTKSENTWETTRWCRGGGSEDQPR